MGEPAPQEISWPTCPYANQPFMKGYSGVRPQLIQLLVELFNRGVTPVVPQQGSVGASGDLVGPTMSAVLMGEGQAWVEGELLPGAEALARVNLTPHFLEAGEGLPPN